MAVASGLDLPCGDNVGCKNQYRGICGNRTGCFSQMLFNDTGCTYLWRMISLYMDIVVFGGNYLVVLTIVSRHNRDFVMCITNFCKASIVAVQWDCMI